MKIPKTPEGGKNQVTCTPDQGNSATVGVLGYSCSWFSLAWWDGHVGVQNNGKMSLKFTIIIESNYFLIIFLYTNKATVTSRENRELKVTNYITMQMNAVAYNLRFETTKDSFSSIKRWTKLYRWTPRRLTIASLTAIMVAKFKIIMIIKIYNFFRAYTGDSMRQ